MNKSPREAIEVHLSGGGEILETRPPSPSGWQIELGRGNPYGLNPGSVRFLKERSTGNRLVSATTYEDSLGRSWLMFFHLFRDGAGHWKVIGSAGGGTDRIIRARPWVNLAGGGWPDMFYTGGRVEENGVGITKVRIVDRQGLTKEDTNDSGLVLFLSEDPVQMPLTVELYSEEKLVESHAWG